MFRPHKMKKVTILGLGKDRNTVLHKLHGLGVFQPINLKSSKYKEHLEQTGLEEDTNTISEHLIDVSRLVNILKIAPRKLNFTQKTFGLDYLDKAPVEKRDVKEILAESTYFLKKNKEPLIKLEEEYNDCLDKDEHLQEAQRIIELFTSLDLPVSYIKDTRFTSMVTGSVATTHVKKLKEELEKETKGHVYLVSRTYSKKESIIVVITLKEYIADVNFIIKKHNVNLFTIPDLPKEKDLISWVKAEKEANEKEKQKIVDEIKTYQRKRLKEGVILREELEILKERCEVLHGMLKSSSSFMLQGWVIDKLAHRLEEEIKKLTHKYVVVTIEDPSGEDNPPIELTNPKYLKPFEMLTELFALPNYGDLDPTFIVAPLFLMYAGFMLTDAVYGLFLMILGWIIIKKFAKYSKGFKYMAINLMGMGAFTSLFGILTGSYFGDLPYYVFGITTEQLAIWKDPLTEPLYFLILSLAVGAIHLNVGLFLGSLEDIRKKQWKTLVKERLIWYVLQAGVVLLVFPQTSFVGKIVLGIAVLGIVILAGPLGLLDITGLMGDIISYARLFALALSTAGIAMAVNLLANLVNAIPYVGIVLVVLVFVIGHLFGFVMNALGAFVHSLRLHFVEFFGKFYEGGGDRFAPLKEERVYTETNNNLKWLK